jgi:hypothetical protein
VLSGGVGRLAPCIAEDAALERHQPAQPELGGDRSQTVAAERGRDLPVAAAPPPPGSAAHHRPTNTPADAPAPRTPPCVPTSNDSRPGPNPRLSRYSATRVSLDQESTRADPPFTSSDLPTPALSILVDQLARSLPVVALLSSSPRDMTVHYERRADILTALLHLGCAPIGAPSSDKQPARGLSVTRASTRRNAPSYGDTSGACYRADSPDRAHPVAPDRSSAHMAA